MTVFTEPFFLNETDARAKIESIRWPNGPVCGKCGESSRFYATKKEGRYRCGNLACRKDFTVTTGTVMESSHIPLHKWLLAFFLLCSSKKGISSHQLMRSLGVTYKSAWFLSHRIREAMKDGGLLAPMGGAGQIVEADETYHAKADIRFSEPPIAASCKQLKLAEKFTPGGLGPLAYSQWPPVNPRDIYTGSCQIIIENLIREGSREGAALPAPLVLP